MADSSPSLDRARLEELYGRLEKPLYNMVYRWVWDREEARDLVQEAFMRLWRMRSRVRLETVEALLFRIAMNQAANRWRWKRLKKWVGLDSMPDLQSSDPGESERMGERERDLAIRRAIEALPERMKRVVLLTEFSGMTYEEVGAALGIPRGTVASRRNSAIRLLRERLRPIMETEHVR